MGKSTEFYICGAADRNVAEIASSADDTDFAILGAVLLTAGGDGRVNAEAVSELGRFGEADINASLKFWKGAGVISASKRAEKTASSEETEQQSVIAPVYAKKYSNDELVAVIEQDIGTDFIDEVQKAVGKPVFNKNEIERIVNMVKGFGFEKEAVLAIVDYSVYLGKKSLSYAEKIALTFLDEGITATDSVYLRIDELKRRSSTIEKIRSLYGFGGRTLTTAEKNYFAAWTEKYGFDFDVIKKAYELTVDTIQSPVPKYTDKILKNWYENGLKTVAEIDGFIAAEKEKAKNAEHTRQRSVPAKSPEKTEKGRDVDDWFEAKLNKHFGN